MDELEFTIIILKAITGMKLSNEICAVILQLGRGHVEANIQSMKRLAQLTE